MRTKPTFLPVELARHVVQIAKASSETITTATVTGGEALLHPDVCEIVREIRRVTAKVTVSTNALRLSDSMSYDLGAAGVTKFRIDVDPYRMLDSGWNDAGLDTARLSSSVRKASKHGAKVELNSVLTRYTLPQLVKLLCFCRDNSLNIKFFERVLLGSDSVFRPSPDISSETLDEATEQLEWRAQKVAQPGTGDFEYVGLGFAVRFCAFLCSYGKCGFSGTRVDPEGNVSICMNASQEITLAAGEPFGVSVEKVLRAVANGCRNVSPQSQELK